ncbi:HesA/MoeB/ThiF family protein [Streptomyces hainanensis]|uniref:ThiF family adenylyltransferase n=1 Tax=Streptomyces hainanensis TaxID=402648 RepID=A0A4R4SIV0_9ACTN|nr:ThiF family adenylyltransferase [Streptomyces hainanensis]TDC63471.1 ThiF family adenylyltransferase [Streptomyces hainanensis]
MRRPRVKVEHLPHRHTEGLVRIGGDVYGLAAEIRDPHGWVWAALALLDGEHSPAGVIRRLCEDFPELSPRTAAGLVAELIDSGYVEDAADQSTPEGLSVAEAERYGRNQAFFRRVDLRPRPGRWDAQLRLRNARVLVLGLGGTGSHAAWALAAAGTGRLHCVDADVVELTNLTRQALYTEADLGRPKVTAAASALRAVNSEVTVTTERRMVHTAAELTELLAGFDVLAMCADESPVEDVNIMASRACVAAGVPWVGGGYNGPLVSVGTYAPEGPCYECVAAGEEARVAPGQPMPVIGGHGVIAPSAAISGQLVAYEIISLLTDTARQPPGYVRGVNLIAPDHLVYVRHPAREGCELCGPGRAGG